MHDLIVRGGTIIDGSGAERFEGDVAVDNGRITAVGAVVGKGRVLKRRADCWATVSAAGARDLERLAGLPAGTVEVVHNGVAEPADEPPPMEVASLIEGRPAVVAFGDPEPHKGFDTFRRVAEAVASSRPEARFVWIGAREREERGPVTLVPSLPAIGWVLRRAALVLLPSRAEGLPLVLLEAWACGAPVVASTVGGIPEVARDRGAARLVAPGEDAAWTSAVEGLLSDDAGRAALGKAGRAAWESRFTLAAMTARYQRLLERLIANRSKVRRG